MLNFGIIFSLIALFAWGFGDFFVQKAVRKIGIWKSLFFIGIFGSILLLPFVANEISSVISQTNGLYLLLFLGVITTISSLFYSEALKEGKIAIVDPLVGVELPITVGLSIVLGGEHLSFVQGLLVILTFIGIVLTVTKYSSHLHYHRRIFEKGVILAGIGAIGMALTNYLVGRSSQEISALTTIWFAHTFMAVFSIGYLFGTNQVKTLIEDLRISPRTILLQSLLDNAGWLAFAFATTYISISIATTLSESYIVLSVLLGVFVNREKLRSHQFIGIIVVILSILALSSIT